MFTLSLALTVAITMAHGLQTSGKSWMDPGSSLGTGQIQSIFAQVKALTGMLAVEKRIQNIGSVAVFTYMPAVFR